MLHSCEFEISQDLQPLSPFASRNSTQVQSLAGMIECNVFHSKIAPPSSKIISRAYDMHHSYVSSKNRLLNVLLVGGDCILPILVYMSKVDGGFKFSPISVNFLTELAKVIFSIIMLLFQLYFNHATVKMLSNLKWEALALLLIGISINQLRSFLEGTTSLGVSIATGTYWVKLPSLHNEVS
ncbi:IBR domain-containing protein isoform 1 [Hibiscus syriacus]|uniref:IBR domain-containing protein isoform 1 n=1 Tax=Hibiscus syriacus TaxID=106335 RepID=A0A6A3BSG4_HIBSY|nr:IBR domain-containing protein isoform 1 [Hibiscus syriacus]